MRHTATFMTKKLSWKYRLAIDNTVLYMVFLYLTVFMGGCQGNRGDFCTIVKCSRDLDGTAISPDSCSFTVFLETLSGQSMDSHASIDRAQLIWLPEYASCCNWYRYIVPLHTHTHSMHLAPSVSMYPGTVESVIHMAYPCIYGLFIWCLLMNIDYQPHIISWCCASTIVESELWLSAVEFYCMCPFDLDHRYGH